MLDDHNKSIARAFAAVQQDVLPGLGLAWDKSGPAVCLVVEYAVARLWLESGGSLEDLLEMAYAAAPSSDVTSFGSAKPA